MKPAALRRCVEALAVLFSVAPPHQTPIPLPPPLLPRLLPPSASSGSAHVPGHDHRTDDADLLDAFLHRLGAAVLSGGNCGYAGVWMCGRSRLPPVPTCAPPCMEVFGTVHNGCVDTHTTGSPIVALSPSPTCSPAPGLPHFLSPFSGVPAVQCAQGGHVCPRSLGEGAMCVEVVGEGAAGAWGRGGGSAFMSPYQDILQAPYTLLLPPTHPHFFSPRRLCLSASGFSL